MLSLQLQMVHAIACAVSPLPVGWHQPSCWHGAGMLAAAVVTSSGTAGSCGAELGKQTPGESTTVGAVLRFCSPQSHPIALPAGTLANKVKRKDTLAMKLGNTVAVQEEKFVFPRKSKEEWNEIRNQIGSTLTRYHKQRRATCEPSVRLGGGLDKAGVLSKQPLL